ncbi:MAG: hypothetical protein H6R10_2950 [Rhodocyclaceae bacterium]|nr:hypothetical protein [Rhodocyclaceae bacterium]
MKGVLLAKPNYQFEKRQRDLAKKQKQEEKRRQKQEAKVAAGSVPAIAGVTPPVGVPDDITLPAPDGETPGSETP